jgi:hypothetical protein
MDECSPIDEPQPAGTQLRTWDTPALRPIPVEAGTEGKLAVLTSEVTTGDGFQFGPS